MLTSPHVHGSIGFCVFAMILFLMSFWESKKGQEALVLVGLQANPYPNPNLGEGGEVSGVRVRCGVRTQPGWG